LNFVRTEKAAHTLGLVRPLGGAPPFNFTLKVRL
jgi:hypothetical protein